jgi:dienelactone hydrolase
MKNLSLLLMIPFLISCGGEESDAIEDENADIDTLIEGETNDYETVEFQTVDGLTVSGNLYEIEDPKKVILLCHQARFNKFEYEGIAQRLNEIGYTCLAIDQRSGGPIANQVNETNLRAKEKGMGVDYLDAREDIKSGIEYLQDKYNSKVIIWGSSYSSTLVLYEAASNDAVEAVVSFSPGNYFADTLGSLVPIYADFSKPMFLTSGKWEAAQVTEIVEGKEMESNQIQFIPEADGHHGSRALWDNQDGGEEYWDAITEWLDSLP